MTEDVTLRLLIDQSALKPVLDWFAADQERCRTIEVYNKELKHQREHGIFPVKVQPEYEAMEAANRAYWDATKALANSQEAIIRNIKVSGDDSKEELAIAKAALQPFAQFSENYSDQEDDDFQVWKDLNQPVPRLILKHFRDAHKAFFSIGKEARIYSGEGIDELLGIVFNERFKGVERPRAPAWTASLSGGPDFWRGRVGAVVKTIFDRIKQRGIKEAEQDFK